MSIRNTGWEGEPVECAEPWGYALIDRNDAVHDHDRLKMAVTVEQFAVVLNGQLGNLCKAKQPSSPA